MFKNQDKRFITKGIDMRIPKEIQVVCWQLVDNLVKEKEVEVDYLQIFEFEKHQEEKLLITHRQEEPEYQKTYELKLEESIVNFDVSKLWLIDDGENQTMLLPTEY
ncbi:hypothetical protein JZO82_06505 [Vagococcus fluvialis]|jgi:hypothetical protein|uniref:DUF960 family protein n=1 Tax=Vagococcus fluvialis TaxID=2738 RepID=UPI001A904268|nr:DUF960 family protein [Vagococcus fluvialis]MBO0428813.1 hypothetical protein [Vagococcus fluvialis]